MRCGWLGKIMIWLFALLVVSVLVAEAIQYPLGGESRAKRESTTARSYALALLEQRYARAEIGSEEHLRKREHLKRG